VRSTVLRELTSVRDLDLRSIDVDVVDGAVTLRGHLPSPTVHDAAIAAVLNCREVAGIADGTDTRQRHDTPSDADILAAARLAIAAAANTAAPCIDVSVHGGIVTLRGPIAWNFQRDAVAAAIEDLAGVVTVVNELVIVPVLPDVSPEHVRRRVAAALARRGLGPPSSLDVTVDSDVVTLTGVLGSQVTIREALEAAASTSGVAGVVDRLAVDDHANQ
jgi:osmotically-inducible protein OsmY